MSGTMTPYIVRQGDYLAKLAFVHGFDADEIWNDPKNEEIKKLRPDPNILAPGDIVYIPEKKEGDGLPIEKGTENNYAATVPKVEVTLVFKDADGKPLADEPFEVHGLGDVAGADAPGKTTEGDGKLTLKVPVTVREVSVHFPQQNTTYKVRIGEMDPGSEESGVKKRLHNLGHWYEDPLIPMDEGETLRLALRQFQDRSGIEVTGALDDATRAALESGHGL